MKSYIYDIDNENMLEEGDNNQKILSVTFNKSKTGNISPRIGIPISWARKLSISETDKTVKVSLNNNKIIIEKYNESTDDDFKGQGILCIRKEEYPVQLHLKKEDKNGYRLYAFSEKSIVDSDIPLTTQDMLNPILKNIELKDSKNNIFEAKSFENIFIVSSRNKNTEFEITSKPGYFKLDTQTESEYHIVYYDNFTMRTSLGFQYNDTIIRNLLMLRKDSMIQIYDKNNLSDDYLEEIILILELLQGQKIKKVLEFKKEKEVIVYGNTSNNLSTTCNPILSHYHYSNEFVKRFLEFLKSQSQIEKDKWKRAIRLFTFYNASQNIEFLIKLFQFINIFKNPNNEKEKYKEILCNKFNIQSPEEALFITKTRNDTVHEGLFLDEAIKKNISCLENSNSVLKKYLDKNMEKAPYIYVFYLEKLITDFIEREIFSKNNEFNFKNPLSFFLDNGSSIFKNYDYIISQIIELK